MISYYQSLEMMLEIRFADEFSIPRIAQLTQGAATFLTGRAGGTGRTYAG